MRLALLLLALAGCKARDPDPWPWGDGDDDDDNGPMTDYSGYGDDDDDDRPPPYDGPYALTAADRVWLAGEPFDEAGRGLDLGDADDDGVDEVLLGTPSGFI